MSRAKAKAPPPDAMAALVRASEWGPENRFEAELVARLFEGEAPHQVLPSAGHSGWRVIGMLVKLCREVRR